jgi:tetratricopeptide (TPR) repeat protein
MTFAAATLLALLAIGCAGAGGPGDSVKGISDEDANKLNSQHSRFEASQDPPFTADTRFAAGRLAESQNAPQAAIQQYNEALKINPKHEASLYRLGVVQTQLKLYPDAIKTWK